MKKLLLVIIVLLSFMFVGCNNDDENLRDMIDKQQEQIDRLNQALLEIYVIEENGKLYTNCRVENGIKVCDEISIVTDEELQLNLRYWFNEYCKVKE